MTTFYYTISLFMRSDPYPKIKTETFNQNIIIRSIKYYTFYSPGYIRRTGKNNILRYKDFLEKNPFQNHSIKTPKVKSTGLRTQ